ncbi:ABC transporter substrate-binding protein [Paenibacillus yanchengensis]|uniref:ABC transporter substrate-binding protein n=1 Tax=Paenibacillus yanchengensis TaxID=2035833 RepID=A0ABW4YNX8_9BACL
MRQRLYKGQINFLFVIVIILIVALLSPFMKLYNKQHTSVPDNVVNLIYYTIGEPDKDLKLVNDKINELLMEKLGITITYIKVGWQEYDDRLNTLLAAGTPFDIAFTDDYASDTQRHAWLRLDEYLSTIGKEMYKAIDPAFWQGARINDSGIYGIPTNKELAVRQHWMYPEVLVNKYKIDISNYTTLASLEPLLETIKQQEPNYIPMELDRDSHNFFALDGYEYFKNKSLPLMINSFDPQAPVEKIFETETARKVLDTLRNYYVLGYINEDAAVRQNQALTWGEKTFWKAAEGGPLSENSWSKDRGYKVVAHPVTPPLITTESLHGGMMVISAETKHPVESIQFLNLLNTDPELRNLFNYGIEGIHYTLDTNGQVVPKPPLNKNREQIADAPPSYRGVQYTQGNWFILKTIGGDFPDPYNKWEYFHRANKKSSPSALLGFSPNLSDFQHQVQAIKAVWIKYYPSLMTGSVDVDKELPKFNRELREAGIDEVLVEVQKQLDAWRNAQK